MSKSLKRRAVSWRTVCRICRSPRRPGRAQVEQSALP